MDEDQFNQMHELAKTAMSMAHNAMNELKRVADALGTEERGDALVEVARNAHAAEQELAALKRTNNK